MHFLIGLGILAGLVWFAFGAGAARAVVGVVLALPVLVILIFITGEATRGGPDDVPFGKLGHRVHVEQQQQLVERSVPAQAALTSPPSNPAQLEAKERAYQEDQAKSAAERAAWTRACQAPYGDDPLVYQYEKAQCNLVPADYNGYPMWDRLPRPLQSRR